VVVEFYEGICGGHFTHATITHKITRADYCWLTIFNGSYAMIRKCISFQRFSRKKKRVVMLLQPIIVEEPFVEWGLDVIGSICNVLSRPGWVTPHKYLLLAL
jgi:hypothetical protein